MEIEPRLLNWKGRTDHLQSMHIEFLQKEIHCDVTLATGKDRFKAHLFVLCASSDYFKDILTSIIPGQYPVIFLKGATSQEIKWLLEYIYKGEVLIPTDCLEQFINFAQFLGIKGLCETQNEDVLHCATPDNVSQIVEVDPSLTPELGIPIITSHIQLTPQKRVPATDPANSAKKLKLAKEKQLNNGFAGSSYNENDSSLDVFDESAILNSPPRSPSVIFDISNNDHIPVIAQIQTQASVIFVDKEAEQIVEISDDETEIEPTKSPNLPVEIDNSSEEALPSPVDRDRQPENSHPQAVISLDSPFVDQFVNSDNSDESEIINVIRKTTSRRMVFHSSSSSEEPLIINKQLKVVLSRCAEYLNTAEANVSNQNERGDDVIRTMRNLSPPLHLEETSNNDRAGIVEFHQSESNSSAVVLSKTLRNKKKQTRYKKR